MSPKAKAPASPFPAPQVGDVVHFVLGGGPGKGVHRPATVVGVNDAESGDLALRVFTHGAADQDMYDSGLVFIPSALPAHPDDEEEHTWHPKDDTTGVKAKGEAATAAKTG